MRARAWEDNNKKDNKDNYTPNGEDNKDNFKIIDFILISPTARTICSFASLTRPYDVWILISLRSNDLLRRTMIIVLKKQDNCLPKKR